MPGGVAGVQPDGCPLCRLKDQSNQNPGSVSGPTSSGSFALSLIRGPPQRTIHGPVRLARRPASHPPDQCQGSAVTCVALCVVSDIAVKKRFRLRAVVNYRATRQTGIPLFNGQS
ncbi:hypothetical protein RYA07_06360 [Pseudomonas syringae pv. actinidiae]|nr:hypothetical protein [Pseudomonas syringae pv. actinidiae]